MAEEQKNQAKNNNKENTAKSADKKEDLEEVKVMAALAYVIFFLPLITHPKSEFGKFHANQGLLLLIFSVGGWIIGSVLTVVLIGLLILPLVWIASFVFFIMGLMNALNKEMKRLPLIGQFDLIK